MDEWDDEEEYDDIVKLSGGPNFDPIKKQRSEAEKLRRANDFGYSPFLIGRASAKQPDRQVQRPLFGELWRTGELAVLFGEPGVGKSLLATQIAEVIARGAKDSVNGLPTSKPQPVIYFDLERTAEAFSRIYSCRPFPSTPYRHEYRFSPRFHIARVDDVEHLPEAFKTFDTYIRHWLFEEIVTSEAKVCIIDSIAHLTIGTTAEKMMRALRAAAAQAGSSVLLVAQAKPKRRPTAVTLADVTVRALLDADSIFALCRSAVHPDIRYVKDLKARSAPLTADIAAAIRAELELYPDADDGDRPMSAALTGIPELPTPPSAVLAYRLERLASPVIEPPGTKLQHPGSAPFLGLNFLGLSLESKHLPARTRTSADRKPKLASATEALTQGLIDGSYKRYLLKE